jgi:hypothetical protein
MVFDFFPGKRTDNIGYHMTERSDTTILGTLGILAHFRHYRQLTIIRH